MVAHCAGIHVARTCARRADVPTPDPSAVASVQDQVGVQTKRPDDIRTRLATHNIPGTLTSTRIGREGTLFGALGLGSVELRPADSDPGQPSAAHRCLPFGV